MSKSKRISVNTLEKIVKENYEPETTIDWHGVELSVKKTLSFDEMMAFVDLCVNACFKPEDNAYMPEKRSFAIKNCLIGMYTNVSLPENLEKRYFLLHCSDLVQTVMQCIDERQFEEICDAISAKIEYRVNANIEGVTRQMNELYAIVENLGNQFEGVLSGVSNDDMKALVGAMANGGLDEKKLVQAYMARKEGK